MSQTDKHRQTLHFDIVIIGSGAGGGTVAKELAPLCKKGLTIALLEMGPRHLPHENTRQEFEMAQKYYFNGGGFQTQSKDMTLAFAKGLGGSTNVYTGVTFKLPQHAVDKWNIDGINLQDLDPRMNKYLAENGAHFESSENINQNNQLFKQGCEHLNWHVDEFLINTRNCAGLATCNLGCPRSAKQGTAVVQIPVAEAAGVEVITHCQVERIVYDSADDIRVHADLTQSNKLYAQGAYDIRAGKVVVCAGAIHSPALLMRSFGKNFHPDIGRYLTCHPAMIIAGEYAQSLDSTQGSPKNYYSKQFVEHDRFLLESCMYFPFSFARNLVGFGPEVDEFIGRYPHLQMILALVLDDALPDNRVDIDRAGQAQVYYEISDNIRACFVEALKASGRLMFAAGAKRVHLPGTKAFYTYAHQADELDTLLTTEHLKPGQVTIASAHLMGGCRMGNSPEEGVCDNRGRLYNYKNIYVADGSLFPSCAEVNPYLTIMALADRVAEGIRQELELEGSQARS